MRKSFTFKVVGSKSTYPFLNLQQATKALHIANSLGKQAIII